MAKSILNFIRVIGLMGAVIAAFIMMLQSVLWYQALLWLLIAVVLILFGFEIFLKNHKKKQ